jgi:hypothetical protein
VNEVLKLLSTAAAGALDVWVGMITGVALGLSPALSGTVSIASALIGITLVVAAGGRLQHLIYRSFSLPLFTNVPEGVFSEVHIQEAV